MNTIKLTKEEICDLYSGDLERFESVEDGPWEQDGKYQNAVFIVKEISTGKFYGYSLSRSGSYHTDWYYSFEDQGEMLVEVKPIEKTVVVRTWENV